VLLAIYASLAVVVALFFTGAQVGPCLGGVGPGQDELRRQCFERWAESRPLIEKLLASPLFAVTLFVALVAVTAWLNRDRGPRRDQAE
jgi:hypothetical protein